MSVLVYNGITLDVLETRQCDRQVRYTEDKAEMLWEDWTIAVVATWNAAVPGTQDPTSPALNDIAVRQLLLTPNRILTFSFLGIPAGGGTPVLQTILTAPESAGAGGSLNPCDSENGPTPLFCTISRVLGDATTFMVSYTIKASVRACPSAPVTPLVSNRWQMSYQYDREHYLTTRVTTGRAVVDVGEMRAINRYADFFRSFFFFPIPPDFQRDVVNVNASSDGTSIDYTVIDVEKPIQVNALSGFSPGAPNPPQVATVDVAYTQAYQQKSWVGGLVNTLGTIANYKFATEGGGLGLVAGAGRTVGKIAAGALGAAGLVESLWPLFEEEVTVNVTGNTYSKKVRLFQLALSIAFAMVPRDRAFGLTKAKPSGKMVVTYDMVGKAVTVTYGRSYGAFTDTTIGFYSMVYDSVAEKVVGKNYPFGPVFGGGFVIVPLPDAGFTVLADSFKGSDNINPFPPGDGAYTPQDLEGYAGSYLVQLVTQALRSPCAAPVFPGDLQEQRLPGFNEEPLTGKG